MANDQQIEFIEACRTALLDGSLKRVVFNGHGAKDNKFRATFDLVVGGKKNFITYSDSQSKEPRRLEPDGEELQRMMMAAPIMPFRTGLLCTAKFDLHYSENRKAQPRVYRAKASMKDVDQNHNRAKNYVLDSKRPYLHGLGVTSNKGDVLKKHYGKFRQIANFVEIIDRDIGTFVAEAETPISMLDLGCGKGYLTFATYDYVRSRAQHEPRARGIDIKTNVIDLCNGLADRLDFSGLEFQNARIQPSKAQDVDILIALHACDTATDDALALGLRSNMQYFFCAPCCQAEIAAQIELSGSDFDLVNRFGLMKRRQADIITDVCRALLLQSFGYDVKFLEFTALEHTSKNVMLAGRRDPSVDRQKAFEDYQRLKQSAGFTRHALEVNTADLRG